MHPSKPKVWGKMLKPSWDTLSVTGVSRGRGAKYRPGNPKGVLSHTRFTFPTGSFLLWQLAARRAAVSARSASDLPGHARVPRKGGGAVSGCHGLGPMCRDRQTETRETEKQKCREQGRERQREAKRENVESS